MGVAYEVEQASIPGQLAQDVERSRREVCPLPGLIRAQFNQAALKHAPDSKRYLELFRLRRCELRPQRQAVRHGREPTEVHAQLAAVSARARAR